jgi:carboxyl-terminal processing protease
LFFSKSKANAGGFNWRTVLAGLLLLLALWLVVIIISNYQSFGNLIRYQSLGNLIRVVSIVQTQYLHAVELDQMIEGAVKGLVESLDDPYSVYLDPDTFAGLQEQIKGSFGGLGILVGVRNDVLTVIRTYRETPAFREGIKDGDVIIGIDGQDAVGMDLDTAVALMRGPAGTEVRILVQRVGVATPLPFTITREMISVPTVESEPVEGTKIQYITISQFTERTASEMRRILAQIEEEAAAGIIIDLRDNPGGELTAAVDVAGNFVPAGPIVYIENRIGWENVYESEGPIIELPLVVLINDGSASASEILAGAIKDTGSGVLVGTTTFGKGVVQTVFRLGNGAGLKLTTAHYLTPAKNNIDEKGIEPDYLVEQDDTRAGEDLQMKKALEIMNEMLN